MKLAGILSSKDRRAVWERNNSGPPPVEPVTEPQPEAQPDGTYLIHGRKYSPEAAAIYQKNNAVHTVCGDVAVAGINDPWLSRTVPPAEALDADAATRALQIQAYFEEQARPRRTPRRVDGTSSWMTEP